MIVHRDIDNFRVRSPVVTVGIFDGVHLGHKHILDRLSEVSASSRGETVIVTFWPHPRLVLNTEDTDFRLLTTLDEKIRMLEETGIQHLVIIPFTKGFSRMSSCDFIENILVEKIGIGELVVGYNHRFGKDREGDFDKLKEYAGQYGFGIEKRDALHLAGRKISSSEIRKLLGAGNIGEANRLLGRTYGFSGEVVGGSRLGTSIGFPTANITPDDKHKLLPAEGVYAVEAGMKGKVYSGMMNIGSRPTVNRDPGRKTVEVHLIDFLGDIYHEQIQIRFISRLREEKHFSGIDDLKKQLEKDREMTIRVFRDLRFRVKE